MAYVDRDASGQLIGPTIQPIVRKFELFDASSIVLASVAALWREEVKPKRDPEFVFKMVDVPR